jgi:hypothetical protein
MHDHGYTRRTEFSVHTRGGIVRARLFLEDLPGINNP